MCLAFAFQFGHGIELSCLTHTIHRPVFLLSDHHEAVHRNYPPYTGHWNETGEIDLYPFYLLLVMCAKISYNAIHLSVELLCGPRL